MHTAPIPPTLFQRVVPPAKRFPMLIWGVVWALAATALAARFAATGDWRLLATFLPLVTGTAAAALTFHYIYRELWGWQTDARFFNAPSAEVEAWLIRHLDRAARDHLSVPFASAFAIVSLIAFHAASTFEGYSPGEFGALAALTLVASMACGVSLLGLVRFGQVIWDSGRFPIVVEPHRFGVLSTGDMMMRSYFAIGGVWFLYTLSATGTPTLSTVPLLVLAAPAFLLVLLSFFACQWPLHQRMVMYKKRRLSELDAMLARAHAAAADDLSTDALYRLEVLMALRQEASGLPEWPFGWLSATGAATAALGAVIPAVIELAARGLPALVLGVFSL